VAFFNASPADTQRLAADRRILAVIATPPQDIKEEVPELQAA
jgi:hypothetical protein